MCEVHLTVLKVIFSIVPRLGPCQYVILFIKTLNFSFETVVFRHVSGNLNN